MESGKFNFCTSVVPKTDKLLAFWVVSVDHNWFPSVKVVIFLINTFALDALEVFMGVFSQLDPFFWRMFVKGSIVENFEGNPGFRLIFSVEINSLGG